MFGTKKETKKHDAKEPHPPPIVPVADFFYHAMIYDPPTKEELEQRKEHQKQVQDEIKARKDKDDDIRHHAWE